MDSGFHPPGKQFLQFTVRFCFTLPDNKYSPALLSEKFRIPSISSDVVSEFLFPELSPCFRGINCTATFMPVPETTVHEDYCSVPGQNDIRGTRQSLPVEPEAVTHSVKS